jgi:hypothetical protein
MLPRRILLCWAVACWVLCLSSGACAQTLQVIDTGGHATTVTAAQIASLPHVAVSVADHDKPAQFEGAPLAALLSQAGIQLGDSLRGPRLTEALLVEAADGYKVCLRSRK